MHPNQSAAFMDNAHKALENPNLQRSLHKLKGGFLKARIRAAEKLPEFEALRDRARDIKTEVVQNLDFYLEAFAAKAEAAGATVHWAESTEDARRIISDICKQAKARKILKGKSMVTEELDLNNALEAEGFEIVETDLGEYIIQIRQEPPSHIIAPAIHVSKEEVEQDFRKQHTDLPDNRELETTEQLVREARTVLREHFLSADVGITGANFLVAETGSSVIVTNEGNGDLTQTLVKTHIVAAGIEKVVPNLDDAATLLRVLARSATGQELSVYTSFSTGPKRHSDQDGPEAMHIVLYDGGRSELLGTPLEDALRCIRCGACLNACPVYGAIGGHAYGWVYPGPIGSVITPALIGQSDARHLPNATSSCGKCEEVCPVRIPLPSMMLRLREQALEAKLAPRSLRLGLKLWSALATRPRVYAAILSVSRRLLSLLSSKKKVVHRLPLAGGWTSVRDMPVPTEPSFRDQIKSRKHTRRRA